MPEAGLSDALPRLRLDKWLWYARFYKSRTLAAAACDDGGIRLNGKRVSKANASVKPADVLTFAQGPYVRVIEVVALGSRRGPAVEAQGLYRDLSPPEQQPRMARPTTVAAREPGSGRPTKRDRRQTERLREGD
ncbi:MAG: RNA-binding S4 domain-containing protein [Alphaproteobacteria bacterium]